MKCIVKIDRPSTRRGQNHGVVVVVVLEWNDACYVLRVLWRRRL